MRFSPNGSSFKHILPRCLHSPHHDNEGFGWPLTTPQSSVRLLPATNPTITRLFVMTGAVTSPSQTPLTHSVLETIYVGGIETKKEH